ncbi:hypothetical protein EZV62_019122 [Acer yangbiense]|uniref:Reverse transcriptase Ty1/copia-type domain-containing protein n=1 Tax=Acer yangbiense TaxID=1000413 RepID=A0A5C7HCG9_9ROSI|nr:hypothetical protein EZV62_019122 [Acer yangbiense]
MQLSKEFDMKDLGATQKILGMQIRRDRVAGKIWLSQAKYIQNILERFNMNEAKPVTTPLAAHYRLSALQCPTTEKELAEMSKLPYASVVGCLIGIRAWKSVPTANMETEDPPVVESSVEDTSGEEEESSSEAAGSQEAEPVHTFGNFNNSVFAMKFDIDKFDGTGDFRIWRRKVKALLSQQKILKAIEGPKKLPDRMNNEQKNDMLEMTLGTIILNLSDNVLREVIDETTACNVWKNLEKLANAGEKEKSSDENEAIIFLNSLHESFKDVKAAIKYGRTSLSLEECISAPKSNELELKIERKDSGENLFVRGR